MSNEMLVSIKNYQRIKKASFKFEPGLNVIVGASNNGKSSTLRAITTALFNLSKDSHVTVGETISAVGIRYNGHEVVWKRDLNSASKNSYKIDGKTFTKLGKGQPQEVADALGIFEIDLDDTKERLNFQKQMAYPFLLDRTPSQVFKFMAQSAEEDNLMSIIDQMKTDQNSIAASIKANEASMDSIKVALLREKKAFDDIKGKAPVCKMIIDLDATVKKFTDLENRLTTVDSLKTVMSTSKDELDEVGRKLPLIIEVTDEASPLLAFVESLESSITKANNVQLTMVSSEAYQKECEKALKVFDNMPPAEVFQDMAQLWAIYSQGCSAREAGKQFGEEIETLDRHIESVGNKLFYGSGLISKAELQQADLKDLFDLIMSANDYQSRCVGYKEEVDELEAQLNEVEQELKLFDVCPYCGSDLRREEHGNH